MADKTSNEKEKSKEIPQHFEVGDKVMLTVRKGTENK